MKMRTPRRWYRRDRRGSAVIGALARIGASVWAAATARRIARGRPLDVGAPVICVGNLTLGGAGKTPVVRELVRCLGASGRVAQVLTRGYGGRSTGPLRVDSGMHDATDVGDEALMMASEAVVWIARDRRAGGRAAAADGADVIVMDDGHQNPDVRKALSILVVDGETRDGEWPFGDGAIFPAGPMREPLPAGLKRADAVVVLLPADLATPDPELLSVLATKPVLIARLTGEAPPPVGPQIGFAGLGKPWKMERALKAAGCDLVGFVSLPDHAALSGRFLENLGRKAASLGAGLITSEKDWVRLPQAWRPRVTAWPVRARFDDEEALKRLIANALPSDHAPAS